MLGHSTSLDRTVVRATLHRQPIVAPDRSVFAYAVRGEIPGIEGGPESSAVLEEAYSTLDPQTIAGRFPLMLRATSGLLTGATAAPRAPGGIMLELPQRLASSPDVAARLVALRTRGIGLVLGDYTGTARQDAILPLVDLVKVDLAQHPDFLPELVERAHDFRIRVIGEHADTAALTSHGLELGVDLFQGPMFERRRADATGRDFTTGETQCLMLLRVLSGSHPAPEAVVRVASADPELTMRVLHLVNSSATGLRRPVDSVRQAVVLLGPRQLITLTIASLINARPATVGTLWSVLARAIACQSLSDSAVGYTVGLLSAVAAQQNLSVDSLITRCGVSDTIAQALRDQTGPYGGVLAAVLAHEENDLDAVAATGLEPWDVAHAYLAAMPEALATATLMSAASRGGR